MAVLRLFMCVRADLRPAQHLMDSDQNEHSVRCREAVSPSPVCEDEEGDLRWSPSAVWRLGCSPLHRNGRSAAVWRGRHVRRIKLHRSRWAVTDWRQQRSKRQEKRFRFCLALNQSISSPSPPHRWNHLHLHGDWSFSLTNVQPGSRIRVSVLRLEPSGGQSLKFVICSLKWKTALALLWIISS